MSGGEGREIKREEWKREKEKERERRREWKAKKSTIQTMDGTGH